MRGLWAGFIGQGGPGGGEGTPECDRRLMFDIVGACQEERRYRILDAGKLAEKLYGLRRRLQKLQRMEDVPTYKACRDGFTVEARHPIVFLKETLRVSYVKLMFYPLALARALEVHNP